MVSADYRLSALSLPTVGIEDDWKAGKLTDHEYSQLSTLQALKKRQGCGLLLLALISLQLLALLVLGIWAFGYLDYNAAVKAAQEADYRWQEIQIEAPKLAYEISAKRRFWLDHGRDPKPSLGIMAREQGLRGRWLQEFELILAKDRTLPDDDWAAQYADLLFRQILESDKPAQLRRMRWQMLVGQYQPEEGSGTENSK